MHFLLPNLKCIKVHNVACVCRKFAHRFLLFEHATSRELYSLACTARNESSIPKNDSTTTKKHHISFSIIVCYTAIYTVFIVQHTHFNHNIVNRMRQNARNRIRCVFLSFYVYVNYVLCAMLFCIAYVRVRVDILSFTFRWLTRVSKHA